MQIISGYKRNVMKTSIFTFLLVLLISFSSCTSRKAIQGHFNLPVTKILNPIKSAINSSGHCITVHDFSANDEANKILSHSEISLIKTTRTDLEKTSEPENSFSKPAQKLFPNNIPFYILFRQIKAFI